MTTFVQEKLIMLGRNTLARSVCLCAPGMPLMQLRAGDWVNVIAFVGTRVRIEREGYMALVERGAIA